MTSNLQNSIWPNPDGILGYNKVQIPDGVTTFWPEGDALVGNFVYNKGKLVGLVDTKALIANESKSTTLPYDYVNIQLDKSLEGVITFNGGAKPEYLKVTYSESTNDYNPNGLPIGYKQLEYLESTGTQHIISNVIPGEDIEIELEYFMSSEISNYSVVLGLSENQTQGSWRINVAGSQSTTGGLMAEYGWWQDYRANPIPSFNSKNKLYFWSRVNEAETSIYKLNENIIPLRPPTVTYPKKELERASYPLALFARKREGNAVSVDSNCPCKIYSVKIATNGQNYYFIPCLDQTGAPCMFDLVSRQTFYNLGTGDFLYPNDVEVIQTTNLDDKFYAQLTEHGVRRLYHVPEGYDMSKDEYAATNGFKEIVEPPMPLEGYWMPIWRETETQLILDWVETEPPAEETSI